ncbi:DUF397 domain-containing protein [Plantactinospora sp. CA-290183]|uniref:DUF397 domain-containing protein n=1 Tax=Plantactinospora sp. CA-290183 TaxID=3240006 RepID=UPI003D8DB9F6
MSQTGSVGITWRKSTRCESQHCVEVAPVGDGVAVRDSIVPDRFIVFPTAAWQAFVGTLRDA